MNRTFVIQKVIDQKGPPCSYLEIGVAGGGNFFQIKSSRKTAVDPEFSFSFFQKCYWTAKNKTNFFAKFHKKESNVFFSQLARDTQFDLILIDGLHTYEQSLRDVINSLKHLKEDGLIIVHDCNPPNETSAYPAKSLKQAFSLDLPEWNSDWCGDVWKTICHLRICRNDLEIFVLDCDFGLGFIWKGKSSGNLNLDLGSLAGMNYEDLSMDRENLLNLKHSSCFFDFLKDLSNSPIE